jgi:Sel1 repeat-containing protein/sporulation related protein
MNPMTVRLFRLVLIVSFIASITGCATTTRLGKTEKPADQATQFEKAKTEFNQQNYERAALLLMPLAKQGHTDAQYALGYMYHNGLGVPRNYKLSIQWLSVASAKGNGKAMEALRRLSLLSSDAVDNSEQTTSSSTQTPVETTEAITAASEEPQAAKTPKLTTPRLPDAPTETAPQREPRETPEVMARTTTSEIITTLTDDEQWIMSQPDKHYTIQLIASGNEVAMHRFINENNLHDSALYYRTRRNGGNWFTLVQGSFESLSLAKSAIRKLTSPLQIAEPWIKPIADIQKALADRQLY